MSVWLGRVDWGSVPDWIAGVGAASALVFAALAVRAANQQNQHQAEQLERLENENRERDAERRREQASKVAIWWERGTGDPGYPYIFKFSNTSDSPVTEVVFTVRTPTSNGQCLAVPYIAPRTREAHSDIFDEVFADHMYEFTSFSGHGPSGDMAGLDFTDMSGRRWRRNLSGDLTLIDRDTYYG